MTDPAAATAYNQQQAQVYDERRFTHEAGKRIHAAEFGQLRVALELMPKGGRAIEVGCGTGRLLMAAREKGYDVEGADASPDMLQMLRAKLGGDQASVRLEVAEAAKLPHEDATFDLVYSIRLLNQTESPEYALRAVAEMIRIAKPGGRLLIEFVNHYRPRIGAARKKTTRLRPSEVAAQARSHGCRVLGFRGCFFLGIQTYHLTPDFLLPLVATMDRALSRLLPRLCARTYVLLRKNDGAPAE